MPAATRDGPERYLTVAVLFNAACYIFSCRSASAGSREHRAKSERNETIVYNDCGTANRDKKKGARCYAISAARVPRCLCNADCYFLSKVDEISGITQMRDSRRKLRRFSRSFISFFLLIPFVAPRPRRIAYSLYCRWFRRNILSAGLSPNSASILTRTETLISVKCATLGRTYSDCDI